MDTLDVILTNTISYMAGIFTGLFVSYYIKERKKKENKVQEKEKDYDSNITDKYSSPIQTALAYPSAPPTPLSLNPAANPDYIEKKKIIITTE